MEEVMIFLGFIFLTIISTMFFLRWIKSLLVILFLSPLVSCIVYLLIVFFLQGYLDPFLLGIIYEFLMLRGFNSLTLIVFVRLYGPAFATSAILLLIVIILRQKKHKHYIPDNIAK